MTTIALPQQLKEELREFGMKGDNYSDIIRKLIDSAKERQLNDLLMNKNDCITVENALKRSISRWQK